MHIVMLALVALQSAPDASPDAGNSFPITADTHRAASGNDAFPLTVAEASGFTRSSRLDQVEAFLEQLAELPAASRLFQQVIGRTTEGRDLIAVTIAAEANAEGEPDTPGRAHVVINANIHGGEIEGKVAVQILLREFALGYHGALLDEFVITVIPVFNSDGNDRIARSNRVSQNGPDFGVGERPNAAGLDLNRDFIKVESPEVQALTWLVGRLEPIAFFDLHTTNGSSHGYDLTYSPSLSPNATPALDEYARETLFPGVRARLAERAEVHVYDYGNFKYERRQRGSRGERGDPIGWSTYDSRPRFGTNLMGLRDTVSILSEAYSYLPYERRVDATYAFVLECLRTLARDRAEIERRISVARAGRVDEAGDPTWSLGVDCELAKGPKVPLRVGIVESVEIDLDPKTEGVQAGTRRISGGPAVVREVEMEVQIAFAPARRVEVGRVWVVLDPSETLTRALQVHLGHMPRALGRPATLELRRFRVASVRRANRPFQGHREVSVEGTWRTATVEVPAGSLIIPCTPLTAHLLHPESDDSLTSWGFFDAGLFADGGEGEPRLDDHPVMIARIAVDDQGPDQDTGR